MLYEEKIIETIPVGPLGLIPLKGCEELVGKVDKYLVDWRNERESEHKTSIAFSGYQRDSYIIRQTHRDLVPARQRARSRRRCAAMICI